MYAMFNLLGSHVGGHSLADYEQLQSKVMLSGGQRHELLVPKLDSLFFRQRSHNVSNRDFSLCDLIYLPYEIYNCRQVLPGLWVIPSVQTLNIDQPSVVDSLMGQVIEIGISLYFLIVVVL